MIFEGTKNQFFFGLGLTRAGSVYPEIERLIEICELFQCSIDQILREDMILNYEALRSNVIVANR